MSIGFKEWSLICDFLEKGSQTVILRKGGIAEGREGFQFRHPAFFLFPTHFHEQEKHLCDRFLAGAAPLGEEAPTADSERKEIAVRLYAETVRTFVLHDWGQVQALAPFHAWSETTVRERFDYKDAPGISVAVLRAYRLPGEWVFPNSNRFGGCRSWLELPECPAALFEGKFPVLDNDAFASVLASLPLPASD